MPVNTRHQAYENMAPLWERVRDAVKGEDAIKAKGAQYLPVPPGIKEGERSREYQNYLRRATYLDVVGPAIEGMVGLMSRKPSEFDLPQSLERLRDTATPDDLSLDGLESRIRHEVLTTGRYVLFVDVPEQGGDPYIATYAAESVINWRTDGPRVTMVVFHEVVREPKADDPFEIEEVEQWREATMQPEFNEDGDVVRESYVVRVWRKAVGQQGEDQFFVVSEVQPSRRGEPLEEVPVVFVGSRDLLPDPDAIPLLGVVNGTLDHYRQMADYRLGLFMSSQATPYAVGVPEQELPQSIGPATIWAASDPNAEFGYLEVSGNGLESQRKALEDTKTQINDEAMRVIGSDSKRGAEAAEALRMRFSSQTATLATVARTTAAGLQQAIRFVAEWANADASQVEVRPNLDFIRETPDPQVLTTIGQLVERGVMPEDILAQYTRKVDLHDMTDEEFAQMAPAAQAVSSETAEP